MFEKLQKSLKETTTIGSSLTYEVHEQKSSLLLDSSFNSPVKFQKAKSNPPLTQLRAEL